MERTKEIALAFEIATALNDLDSLDWHIACANKYPEFVLREKLAYVLSRKNIDNPAGYYTFLIKLYGSRSRN